MNDSLTKERRAPSSMHNRVATLAWWQRGVFYKIALISFQDSDGDGKGDLCGLLQRLDYLEWQGVDAVWLTPVCVSPMLDFGYDIADFCAVDPTFGTLEDFDRLVEGLHQRSIRLILDFVPNHTSNQHPWFNESSASRLNAKRDWYVWEPLWWQCMAMGRHDPAVSTRFCRSSLTSTGATPKCGRQWAM
jgi:alpha-glucosidase